MKTKKFKTAQGFLENHYNHEFDVHDELEENRDAKIRRSERAERNAIRALLSAIGLTATLSDDEDLEQAFLRIQQMPEAQNDRAQHFLMGAEKWVLRGRLISLSSSVTGVRTTAINTP